MPPAAAGRRIGISDSDREASRPRRGIFPCQLRRDIASGTAETGKPVRKGWGKKAATKKAASKKAPAKTATKKAAKKTTAKKAAKKTVKKATAKKVAKKAPAKKAAKPADDDAPF